MESYPSAAKGLKMIVIAHVLMIVALPLSIILIGGMIGLAGEIFYLVGPYTASHDDKNYLIALYAAIALMVVSVAGTLVDGSILALLLSLVNSLLGLFIVYQVCTTTCNLLTGRNDTLIARGKLVITIYLACTVVNMICSVLLFIPFVDIVATVVTVITTVAMLAGYVIYMIFLYGAAKALQ